MRFRMAQIVFIGIALLFALAIFFPLQKVLFLSDREATRCLATKILLLPIPVLCFFGATWAWAGAPPRGVV